MNDAGQEALTEIRAHERECVLRYKAIVFHGTCPTGSTVHVVKYDTRICTAGDGGWRANRQQGRRTAIRIRQSL